MSTTPSGRPTTRCTGWPPASGPGTSPRLTTWPADCRPARCGSTSTTASTPRCRSAASSSPAGVASSARPRWTSTPRPARSTSSSDQAPAAPAPDVQRARATIPPPRPVPTGHPTRKKDPTMKTRAAVLFDLHQPFQIIELDLDDPGPGEVLIKYTAAGLCHSDLHLSYGLRSPRFPRAG